MKLVHADDRVRPSDELPARLTAPDMMRIFGLKKSRFYMLVAAKQFDHLEIRPRIGGRRMWSGKLVMEFLNGERRSRGAA